MSAISRLLRNPISHFISRTFSSSPTPSPIKSLIKDIVAEKDLKKLVDKFKSASGSYRFRCNRRVYNFTISRLLAAQRTSWVEELLEDQKKYVDKSNEGFAVRLITLYGKSGMFGGASQLFDELPQPKTVKTFNALLTAALDSKNYEKVGELFDTLPSKFSIKPDLFSYNILVQALCKMGSLDSAVSMVETMEKNGIKPNSITFNMLLNGFYSNNQFPEAEKIWAMMEEYKCDADICSYNVKLRGLVNDGKIDEAVKLVVELGVHGLKPDTFSYNALIKGYCKEGKVEEAKNVYNELLKRGCRPNRETNKCVVRSGIMQDVIDSLANESKNMGPKKIKALGLSKIYYGPRSKVEA